MRAVLCGYYGMGNGGDEALLAALLQMLPEAMTPIVLSGNPQATAQQYGVEARPRKSLGAVVTALWQADVFIWGGGSLMQDTTSALNPLYYGGLMVLAQVLGVKTVAWAQGVGPLRRRWNRWLTRHVLRGCTRVSVRDRASAALLANWQIPAWLAPDPVWALASQPVTGLWQLPAPRVAVCLRSHPWLSPERLEQLIQALVDFQMATRTCVLLVPFQPSQDRSIAAAIQPRLQGPSEILCLSSPQQLKGVFRGVEMAIAMRLHALIMAAAEGCLSFALSYDPKVTQLMMDLDLPGWEMNPAIAPSTNQPSIDQLSTDRTDRTEATSLSPWPESSAAMTQQWLEHFANGSPASPEQIQSRVDRALMHRELLCQVLAGIPSFKQ